MFEANGKKYLSIKEASLKLGISYWLVYFHLPKMVTIKVSDHIFIEESSLRVFEYVYNFKHPRKKYTYKKNV